MEEEENKTEEKKTEEKKTEENKKTEQEEKEEEAKPEEKKKEESKEIILRVFMHCEGCAKKVRKCLKNFPGVEDVMTNCKSSKVVVKGEKADPLKVLERLQKKIRKKVELLSPLPKSPCEEDDDKKVVEEKPKSEEKKEEPQVISVMIGVHMHCESCAQEMKKRIMKMKGVESAESDLNGSQVKVTGVFDPSKLVDYVHKKTGKLAVILKPESEKEKEEEDNKGKDAVTDGKKDGEEDEDKEKKADDGEKKDGAGEEEEEKAVEMKRNEYYYYPPKNVMENYSYPPQIFSDENPNACSIM